MRNSDCYAMIYAQALAAAVAAVKANAHLENPNALDCGFAWVQVTPASHPFIRWCKLNNKGSKHWKRGWEFWKPGANEAGFCGQSVDVFIKGAEAFATSLRHNLIDCTINVGSRLD